MDEIVAVAEIETEVHAFRVFNQILILLSFFPFGSTMLASYL